MATELLTKTELEHFLANVLQIKHPFARFKDDPVALLNDAIRSFLARVPYQSVVAIATPKPKRRCPTFEEVKTDMMTKMGGLCCECNWFMKTVLEGLGYDVYYVAFDVQGVPDNHLGIVVRDLVRPGDHHLVDVGIGYFIQEPIPLDFTGDSPVRQDSALRHKYVRDPENGSLQWLHAVHGDAFENAYADPVNGWRTFGVSDLKPRPIEYFIPRMEIVHTIERAPEAISPFLLTMRAVFFKDGKLLAIKDSIFMEEDDTGVVHKRRFLDEDDLLEAFKIHFPQFSLETVKRALNTIDLKFQA